MYPDTRVQIPQESNKLFYVSVVIAGFIYLIILSTLPNDVEASPKAVCIKVHLSTSKNIGEMVCGTVVKND